MGGGGGEGEEEGGEGEGGREGEGRGRRGEDALTEVRRELTPPGIAGRGSPREEM